MRTAKNLLPISRQIFHTELLCCPHCGGELKLYNHLTWDKTVQTLGGVLSIASRPSHCIDSNCTGYVQRFVSASGQQIALPGSTYGLPPNTPSPITESKNPPLAAARFDASNDARNETAGHCPPIIKTSAASSTSTIDSQATNDSQLANQVIMQIMRHVRYLLTLKGRPPLRLVGIFMYQRLLSVCKLLDDLLAHRYDYYLNSLREGLKTALAPYSEQFNQLKLASTWMDEISNILEPSALGRSSEEVANQLRDYLNQRLSEHHDNPFLTNFAQHLDNISTNYWPGLFHTYDCEFLPRTNNEIESHFRDTQRRLLRTTGQKGQTKRTLHRYGAWELLPRPPTEAERLEGFLQVSREALKIEQKRLAEHFLAYRWILARLSFLIQNSIILGVTGSNCHLTPQGGGGMRWIKERAEALLQLRCIEVNGDWDAFMLFVHDKMRDEGHKLKKNLALKSKEAAPLPTFGLK